MKYFELFYLGQFPEASLCINLLAIGSILPCFTVTVNWRSFNQQPLCSLMPQKPNIYQALVSALMFFVTAGFTGPSLETKPSDVWRVNEKAATWCATARAFLTITVFL